MKRHVLGLVRAALLASLGACASAPAQPRHAQAPGTPAAERPAPPPARSDAASGAQFQIANTSGELIAVGQVLVTGKITIVDFYADWRAPCKALEKRLRAEIKTEPRIAVRKIDVGKAEAGAVIDRYGVKNLPHVRIYGADGRLLHELVGPAARQTGRLALDALTSL